LKSITGSTFLMKYAGEAKPPCGTRTGAGQWITFA
jgi:hypothetical protein